MLTFSIGMPRAGSGWYYNLTHDLVTATGGQDARQIRRRYHLSRVLTEVNCNIGAFTTPRLLAVMVPALMGNSFVVKAHAAPSPLVLALIRRGWVRAAYIYRDPRDAMLSAFDNGQRALQKGRPNAFSHLTDFDKSVDFMLEYLRIWDNWMACSQALHTRFESLKDDYDKEAACLVAFWAWTCRLKPCRQSWNATVRRRRVLSKKASTSTRARPVASARSSPSSSSRSWRRSLGHT
jgi:hypothetical protein